MIPGYKDFEKYVISKFITMSNFSKVLYGDFTKLTSICNLANNRKNRTRLWWLDKKAHEIEFNYNDVYIDDKELDDLNRKFRIQLGISNRRQWCIKNKFDRVALDNILSGRIIRKNKQYDKFINLLK
jgi:hypothetical protein